MKIFKAFLFVSVFSIGLSLSTSVSATTLNDIQNISARLIKANNLPYSPGVKFYTQTPVAAMLLGKSGKNTLLINPRALRQYSYNDWGFIIGHELAHLVSRKGNFVLAESKADTRGTQFAINAGFDAPKYLAGILARPNG